MTFQEIADELGISRQRAEQIYKKAIRKLQEVCGGAYVNELLSEMAHQRSYAATPRERVQRGGVDGEITKWVATENRLAEGQAEIA